MSIGLSGDVSGTFGTIQINGIDKLQIHSNGYVKTQNGVIISTPLGLSGTCTQSNGVVTGAILEKGTNANGSYVRFANGALIQHFKGVTLTFGTATFTLPSQFINIEYGISAIVQHQTEYNVGIGIHNIATSYFTLSFVATATNGISGYLHSNYAVNISCIGRWF